MKKLALILLTALYALAVFGTASPAMYCCERAAVASNNIDCAHDNYQGTELNVHHTVAASLHFSTRNVQTLHTVVSAFAIIIAGKQPAFSVVGTTRSRLHQPVPVYILQCVYRL
ncbi:MAG: hypothetical protein ABIQ88_21765 [Chitinophagaceae bacterium]